MFAELETLRQLAQTELDLIDMMLRDFEKDRVVHKLFIWKDLERYFGYLNRFLMLRKRVE